MPGRTSRSIPTSASHSRSVVRNAGTSRSKARTCTRSDPAGGTIVSTTSSPGRIDRDRADTSMASASARVSSPIRSTPATGKRRGDIPVAGADAVFGAAGAVGLHANAVELVVRAARRRVAEHVLAVQLLGDAGRRLDEIGRGAGDFRAGAA